MTNLVSKFRLVPAALALSGLLLSGCQSSSGIGNNTAAGLAGGALIGGLGCALAGGNTGQCLVAATAGAIVGGAIGSQMDERDRARREAALAAAVQQDEFWRAQRAVRSSGRSATATVKPRQVGWSEPKSGNSGSITPLRAVERNNRECRVMEETYFKNGEPIRAETTLCQNADGSWPRTAG